MAQVLTVDEALQEGNAASAFVILPSEPAFDGLFRDTIAPALEAAGYNVRRFLAEHDRQPGLADEVTQADFVIADVSDPDGTTMYGLGVARGLWKQILLLAREGCVVPDELSVYRVLHYTRLPQDADPLREQLRALAAQFRYEQAVREDWSVLRRKPMTDENPWLAMAGIFADDPTLEPMLEEIYAEREASR